MTGLEEALRRLVDDLRSLEADFALVGGLAISMRAEPRLTRDVDVAVSVPDDDAAEAVVSSLASVGYEPGALVEHELSGRLAAVRLAHRERPEIVVDLLFASSGIEPEIVAAADELEALPGLVIPVAQIGHLIATKLLARDDRRRPMDADDLRSLAEVAQGDDWETAREAVELIAARGYDRGRDIGAALSQLSPRSGQADN